MKQIKYILLISLATTSFALAQNAGVSKEITIEVDQPVNRNVLQLEKTITEYPVVLDKTDRYKVNQDRKLVQPEIVKVIMLDNDNDLLYDEMIKLNYKQLKDVQFDFRLNESGLTVGTQNNDLRVTKIQKATSNTVVETIRDEGSYKIFLNDGNTSEIEVENYWMTR